jgi:hypothetical protein
MAENKNRSSATHFLNVDLDIYSTYDLQPLVNSLGKEVFALYVGRERRRYCAHLEVAKRTKTADATIRAFCKLILGLPREPRDLWNRATLRSFSIGVQVGNRPTSCDVAIQTNTLTAVCEVAAQIVLTVYAPRESTQLRDAS